MAHVDSEALSALYRLAKLSEDSGNRRDQQQSLESLLDLVVGVEPGDDLLTDIAALVHVDGVFETSFPWIVLVVELEFEGRNSSFHPQHLCCFLPQGRDSSLQQRLPLLGNRRRFSHQPHARTAVVSIRTDDPWAAGADSAQKVEILHSICIDAQCCSNRRCGPRSPDLHHGGGPGEVLHFDLLDEQKSVYPGRQALTCWRARHDQSRRLRRPEEVDQLDDASPVVGEHGGAALSGAEVNDVVGGHAVQEVEVVGAADIQSERNSATVYHLMKWRGRSTRLFERWSASPLDHPPSLPKRQCNVSE